MNGSLVSESFYHGYLYFATGFSCLSNAALIYTIIVTHVNHIGPYRWLLLSFSVVDVLISLIHLAILPVCGRQNPVKYHFPAVHLTEFGYIFWGYRTLNLTTERGFAACTVFALLFYHTFVLIAFHYVYRFVIMCNPSWLSWIQRNPWRNWLAIGAIADVTFVGSIALVAFLGFYPDELARREFAPVMMDNYGIELYSANKPGFMGIVYWTRAEGDTKEWIAGSILTIMFLCMIFFSSSAVMAYCLVRMVKEFAPSGSHLKSATRHMQRQLFRALLWQTIIPTFTSYIPMSLIFIGPPVTGVSFGGLGTILIMSTQIFPMIDPYLVLFFVQGYRRALPKFLQRAINTPALITSMSQSSTTPVIALM